jgi:hypothetical protein
MISGVSRDRDTRAARRGENNERNDRSEKYDAGGRTGQNATGRMFVMAGIRGSILIARGLATENIAAGVEGHHRHQGGDKALPQDRRERDQADCGVPCGRASSQITCSLRLWEYITLGPVRKTQYISDTSNRARGAGALLYLP